MDGKVWPKEIVAVLKLLCIYQVYEIRGSRDGLGQVERVKAYRRRKERRYKWMERQTKQTDNRL